MSVDPVGLGWELIDEGTGGSGIFSGGILQIDAPGVTSFYGYRAPSADWDAAVVDGNWAVEARVHLIEQSATTVVDRGGVHLGASDGARYFLLVLHPDKIEFLEVGGAGPFAGTSSFAMDTTDGFHVYRMEVSGPEVDVFVDGTLVMSATNGGSTSGKVFAFGDLFYENGSLSDWDYVSFEGFTPVSNDGSSWSEVKTRYVESNR